MRESKQKSCIIRAGFRNNMSATKSDRGTSKTSYCYGCQTEIRDKTLVFRSDIYLFLQLPD